LDFDPVHVRSIDVQDTREGEDFLLHCELRQSAEDGGDAALRRRAIVADLLPLRSA
jgi:hypothetical protein